MQLVISDAHAGLKKAMPVAARVAADSTAAFILPAISWPRCQWPQASAKQWGSQNIVAAALLSVFIQPEAQALEQQWDQAITMLTEKLPAASALMEQAWEDVFAFLAFLPDHWRKIRSTNPLERLNKEIKRRTRVVGIAPHDAAIIRLVGALLLVQQEEWWLAGRHVFSELRVLSAPSR